MTVIFASSQAQAGTEAALAEPAVPHVRATVDAHAAVQRRWQAVVVGAGPAGALAAYSLARRGIRTLLLDQKRFPRHKVCGACLNGRAQGVLQAAELSHLLPQLQAVPLKTLRIWSEGQTLALELPNSVAVSRTDLDAALVQAAIEAGAEFLPGVTAILAPNATDRGRAHVAGLEELRVQLCLDHKWSQTPSGLGRHELTSQTVIAADGLGHPSLRKRSEFRGVVQEGSRIGLGAVVSCPAGQLSSNEVTMAIGQSGYVGLVQVGQERLNIAAAVDPQALKTVSTPGELVVSILREAGIAASEGLDAAEWAGTPALTRTLSPVAIPGVFVIGDAAGYVEPFTGEGISWGMTSGLAVADVVDQSLNADPSAACVAWQRTLLRTVRRRQSWCRRLAWLLRHRRGVAVAFRLVSRWPRLARPVLRTMNDPRLGICERQV